jgi:hypothetical protein
MDEYIERETLINQLEDEIEDCGYADASNKPIAYGTILGLKSALSYAKALPTADVVAVGHGEWLKTEAHPHRVYCSLCYKTYVTNEEVIGGRSDGHFIYCSEAEYCPHCGAKMDLKEGAEE